MSTYDPPRIDVEEKTEIIYGDENIIRDTLEVYSVLTTHLIFVMIQTVRQCL